MSAGPADFEDLLRQHLGIVRRTAALYTRTAAEREDLAQEIAAQWWRSFPRFDGRCKFSTWAYRIALNVAISHRRRERARPAPAATDAPEIAAPAERPIEDRLVLRKFIAGLGDFDRALVFLYLDGNSHEEIGQVLGIIAGNAATRMGRLKERFRRQGEDDGAR